MSTRAERVIYVSGDPSVSYGDVTTLIAAIQQTADLRVMLVNQADIDNLSTGMCIGIRPPIH